ncbi:MAG: Fic family protein [bacterium]
MKAEEFTDNATGRLVPIVEEGVELTAFVPDPIPRTLKLSSPIMKLAERAGLRLGRLFGAGEILNPMLQLFLAREAIASNAMEGTITTARQLYLFDRDEGGADDGEMRSERREVANYIKAMNLGINLLAERPLSLNLINALHAKLLENVRGQNKMPGQIRRRQNAISKSRFAAARYIPPPPAEVIPAVGDIESFIHEDSDLPNSVRAALVHYQFEAVHPYLDGNGRLGRLLIPLLLSSWEMLPSGTPRLYLSKYFEQHDEEYRDKLLRVSQNGEWNSWIEFYLTAIVEESEKTWSKAEELIRLRERFIDRIKSGAGNLLEVVRRLFDYPVLTHKDIAGLTGLSRQQAGNYASKLVEVGILTPDKTEWRHYYYADEIFRVFFEESE